MYLIIKISKTLLLKKEAYKNILKVYYIYLLRK